MGELCLRRGLGRRGFDIKVHLFFLVLGLPDRTFSGVFWVVN
jgi:hypothetical protein